MLHMYIIGILPVQLFFGEVIMPRSTCGCRHPSCRQRRKCHTAAETSKLRPHFVGKGFSCRFLLHAHAVRQRQTRQQLHSTLQSD
jgi:hypothetical protein